MIELKPPFGYAKPEDADTLAELINFAGEGLPLYLWERMAEREESAWEVGRRRAKREEGGFSYKNAVLMRHRSEVAACLIGYPLPDRPQPVDYENTPPMFVPMEELERIAAGTWYVNVLAAYPKFRGRGYGTQLLSIAEKLAVDAGKIGLSIIVSDANPRARKLYERKGYRPIAERAMVKEDWQNAGDFWVLLIKWL